MIMVMRRSRYYFQPEREWGGGVTRSPFFGGRGVSEAFQIHYSVTLTCDSKKLIFMGTSRSAHVVFIQ